MFLACVQEGIKDNKKKKETKREREMWSRKVLDEPITWTGVVGFEVFSPVWYQKAKATGNKVILGYGTRAQQQISLDEKRDVSYNV